MQYTTLLRMIIGIMLMYDFGRDTIPYRKTLLATSKDAGVETHVMIALEGKTEIQLPQGIFWSDACPHSHRWGSRLLWNWAHPHNNSQLVKCSLGARPGKQLTAGRRHGKRQEAGLQEEGTCATSSPASRVRHPLFLNLNCNGGPVTPLKERSNSVSLHSYYTNYLLKNQVSTASAQ